MATALRPATPSRPLADEDVSTVRAEHLNLLHRVPALGHLRVEQKQKSGLTPIRPSATKKAKRRPCAEAGIFPIKPKKMNLPHTQGQPGVGPCGPHPERKPAGSLAVPHTLSSALNLGMIGASSRPSTPTAARPPKLQHLLKPVSSKTKKRKRSFSAVRVSSKKLNKSRIPVLVKHNLCDLRKMAELECRKKKLLAQRDEIMAQVDGIDRELSQLLKRKAKPAMHPQIRRVLGNQIQSGMPSGVAKSPSPTISRSSRRRSRSVQLFKTRKFDEHDVDAFSNASPAISLRSPLAYDDPSRQSADEGGASPIFTYQAKRRSRYFKPATETPPSFIVHVVEASDGSIQSACDMVLATPSDRSAVSGNPSPDGSACTDGTPPRFTGDQADRLLPRELSNDPVAIYGNYRTNMPRLSDATPTAFCDRAKSIEEAALSNSLSKRLRHQLQSLFQN